ncbi:MAG TPA: NAD(P)-binding protein [Myxococcales bacterium]|jgi:phytoene dehydrogenase-like protein
MPTDADYFFTAGQKHEGPPLLTAKMPAKAKYKKPDKLLEKPDAIVIGSGIGGMGMASLLAQKKHMKVLLLESSPVPGGCTHVHEIDGFEFASGVDSVGDMDPRVGRGMYRPAIDFLTGGKLKWAKMPEVHEVCTFGDEVYDWYSTHEKNIEWVEKKFPGEGNVRAYYDLEKKIESWATTWALTKLAPEWMPVGMRDGIYFGAWRKYMDRHVLDVFKNELGFSDRLAAIFCYMYGNHGRTPDKAPFSFHSVNLGHYRNGAYFPAGGPGQIAECIVPIVEAAGGQLAVSTAVKQIMVENGQVTGVELENGEKVFCKLVFSAAGAPTTFLEMLDPELSAKLGYAEKFKEIGPSPSHVYLLLGYDEAIDLPKHIVWEMPTYEGVGRYDISKADELYKGQGVLKGMGGYLLSPSARDPLHSERYPNTSTVVALAEGIPDWVARAKKDTVWRDEFAAGLGENLMKIVERHMPMLKGKTPKLRLSGIPMGCNPNAWHGSSLGLDPSAERFVKHTHWLRPRTKIGGLWLTGQDAFSAGFAGSMLSSKVTYAAWTGNYLSMLM